MGRKPTKEQIPENVELIEKLKEKLSCTTDLELAERLRVKHPHISRWKTSTIPEYVKALMLIIIEAEKL